MNGLLLVDKPVGPTSHDIVARVRRVLGERSVGHTGTLDPLASGLLALVLGRATRLARFLSASDKVYEAEIRLGIETDTYDAQGTVVSTMGGGALPSRDRIERALDAFRGTFLQQPPAYSAKKIDGQRSYKIARRARRLPGPPAHPALPAPPAFPAHPALPALPALPAATTVTAHAIDVLLCDADRVRLRVHCSAGFYIRSLAHDLGRQLGIGAHLTALRRTASGALTLATALPLDAIESDPDATARALVPLAGMLPELASVTLSAAGVERVLHGQDVGLGDMETGFGIRDSEFVWDSGFSGDSGLGGNPGGGSLRPDESQIPNPESHLQVRLLDGAGELLAIAEPVMGTSLLHPSVVLR